MKRVIPPWGKEVKKALIDRDMTVTDLAAKINLSKSHVANVVNGRFDFPEVRQRINSYLGISSK